MKAYVTGCIAGDAVAPGKYIGSKLRNTHALWWARVLIWFYFIIFFDQGSTEQVCVLVVHMN